jgi:Na+/melibiose symporter-like transporter
MTMNIRNPILPGFNPDPSIGTVLFAIFKAVALMIYPLDQRRVDEIERELAARRASTVEIKPA